MARDRRGQAKIESRSVRSSYMHLFTGSPPMTRLTYMFELEILITTQARGGYEVGYVFFHCNVTKSRSE